MFTRKYFFPQWHLLPKDLITSVVWHYSKVRLRLMQIFYQWLQNFKSEDTPLGDFACAASFDQDRPQENTLAAWEKHLRAVNACAELIEVLKQEAWPQYASYQQNGDSHPHKAISQDGVDNCPQPNDEEWTIQCPVLPNYWGFYKLLRVCYRPQEDNDHIGTVAISGNMYCEAVEQFGRYFRREFGYDRVPYTVGGHRNEGDEYFHPYLFTGLKSGLIGNVYFHPVGACALRFEGAQIGNR
jgi:hypothetical protein